MANYLSGVGHNVKFLAAKGVAVSYFGLQKEVEILKPEYLEDKLQNFYTLKAIRLIEGNTSSPQISIAGYLRGLANYIVKSIALPDIGLFFLLKFIRRAFQIIRAEDIQILIVSSPPHSSQILGLVVKVVLKKKITLIVDYRDGWNTFSLFRASNFFKRYLCELLEFFVLKNADLFLYQSPAVLKQILQKYFWHSDRLTSKSLLVRNGYTSLDSGSLQIPKKNFSQYDSNGPFRIGYFGGLDFSNSNYRNPIELFRILDRVDREIELIIYGNFIAPENLEVFKNVKVRYMGLVALDKAKEAMHGCNSLLVFHASAEGAEEVIPGKFYEYIDAQRPIIVFGPTNMECGLIVKEMNLGVFLEIDRPEENIKKLRSFIGATDLEEYAKRLWDVRSEFSREAQYKKLETVLSLLMSQKL